MSLLELFNTVPDPREAGKVRYSLGSILFVGLCGVLCGCESWSDIEDYCETKFDWLSLFVDLSNGVPSEWTFRRVFTLLDPSSMEHLLRDYAASLIKGRGQGSDHIAIDGKALRGSGRHDWTCLQSVSAWCHTNGLVLSETAVDIKSQENVAIPLLLKNLDLKGKTVTIDAAGCQKPIASRSSSKKGITFLG